jgi:CelD/BcsL family acetyltransferase involved in cellulose biosynthesis
LTYSINTSDFAELEEPWKKLLGLSTTSTPFNTPLWHRAWWQQFHGTKELLLVSVRRGGEVVGIAPLMRRGHEISLIGSSDLCDYMDIIVAQGQESTVLMALLDYLDPLEWQVIDLLSLPPTSAVLSHLVPLARERGYRVEVMQMDTCPQLELPPTWEEYLSRLSSRHRHEVRRKLRRLDQAGPAHYYAVGGQGGLHQDVDDFTRLFKISRSDKAKFMTPEMVGFFQAMARSMAGEGYLKLFFLEMEGVRVATALCFDYGDARYLYNSGYDPQYAFFSVGLLLKVLCLKKGIEDRKKRFDFLRGVEAYKYDLGGQDVPIYRCLIQRP